MTIRTKLLLFIPLLVILIGSTMFFLYRSANVVQRSYDGMMERLLMYKQAAQTADSLVQTLYRHLDNPTDASAEATRSLELQLGSLRRTLPASSGASSAGYAGMLKTLIEQEQAAMNASSTAESLRIYEEAETTALFIREEASRLIDTELEADRPAFRRIQQENVALSRLGTAVFITETLLAAVLALWISRSITRPVDALVESAGRIARGDLQAEPPLLEGRDELGAMAEAFRGMLGGLRERERLAQEQSEQRRLVNELELRSLQSQIQPHFLFNSLNALSKLALLEGADRTSDLIVSLSQLIRYNLSRRLDRPVSLREELGHVEAYITIQQARFRDRIAFRREIDESALSAPLPPLTLQPIVENAFVHGVEHMEQGAVITLQISRESDGAVRIVVADNGQGMPEQARQALLARPADWTSVKRRDTTEVAAAAASENALGSIAGAAADSASASPPGGGRRAESAGLGTRNVFRRLELFYGMTGLVAIDSAPGQGTRVTLTLPPRPNPPQPGQEPEETMRKENERDVPTADRR